MYIYIYIYLYIYIYILYIYIYIYIYNEKFIIAYRKDKNLKDIIGDATIENNKVLRKQKLILLKEGYCKPCLWKINNLCCNRRRKHNLQRQSHS